VTERAAGFASTNRDFGLDADRVTPAMAHPSAVVSAFGFQLDQQLVGALVKRPHARIAARALQILLIDHDHRFIERVVQLVLVERRSHDLSVPQRDREAGPEIGPGASG
jgi:hypothetical protein